MDDGMAANASSACHAFSATVIRTIIIITTTEASVAVLVSLVTIIVMLALRQYRTFVHRLVLYMMVVGCIHGITQVLEVTPIHHDGKNVAVRDGLDWWCVTVAFAAQVTLSQLMLILMWILTYLFLLVVFKYQAHSRKQEIAGLVITLGLPLTFDWLPFIHHLYGLSGSWCWIRVAGKDCSQLIVLGLVFQNTLFYGPKLLLVALSFVMFMIILVTTCKRRCNRSREVRTRRQHSADQEAVQQALPLVLYPVVYNILVGVMVANRIDYALSVEHDSKPYYPLFIAHVIVDPLRTLFLPLAYLLHPATLRKLLRRQRPRRSEDSETNYPVPPEASFTDVDPLVIRGTEQNAIQDYEAILTSRSEPSATMS